MENNATTEITPDLPELTSGSPQTVHTAARTETAETIPIKITAVLGKTRMRIADLKSIQAGEIIELDRRVGEPIDLFINDRLIARGELVLVDGSLGVTLTELIQSVE